MSGFAACFASVVCLLVILTGPSSALFWHPTPKTIPTYPSDPHDPYYEAFQTVPPPSVTADKLLTNFLHFGQNAKKRFLRIEDNVIVIDGSGSVGSCEFEKGKKALINMMEMAVENKIDGRYAAVTFSTSASRNFNFLPYPSAASQLEQISYPGGSTNTQAGLAEAMNLFNDNSSGGRFSSFKDVLLVTDGKSNVQESLTVPNAEALKNANVQIHVVAIGEYIDGIDEMVRVASTRTDEKLLYRVKDYNGFMKIVDLMLKEVSPDIWSVRQGNYDPPC